MTKFCESCPLRYQATGEIEQIVATDASYVTRALMGRGAVLDSHQGLMGVLADENDNPSMPLKFPNAELDEALERYTSRVDDCDGPIIEYRGLIRKRPYVIDCPALGAAAIRSRSMSSMVLRSCRTELL